MESETIIKLKGIYEVEDLSNKIVGRAVVTEEDSKLVEGLVNVFTFGLKKEEPKPVIEKNEIQAIIFKRMGKEKMMFMEGRWAN